MNAPRFVTWPGAPVWHVQRTGAPAYTLCARRVEVIASRAARLGPEAKRCAFCEGIRRAPVVRFVDDDEGARGSVGARDLGGEV